MFLFIDSANPVCVVLPVREMKINSENVEEIKHVFNY